MDNYSEEDDDSYSSEQEASDDAVHGPVSGRMSEINSNNLFDKHAIECSHNSKSELLIIWICHENIFFPGFRDKYNKKCKAILWYFVILF